MTTTSKARVRTTDAQIDAALAESREREKTATKITAARYDRERDALIVELSTGSTLVVPRAGIAGFARVAPAALADIVIDGACESLWSDTADDGVLLEQLLEIAAGSETLMTIGTRIAGRIKTPARAAASRANGSKGGRPRKPGVPAKKATGRKKAVAKKRRAQVL